MRPLSMKSAPSRRAMVRIDSGERSLDASGSVVAKEKAESPAISAGSTRSRISGLANDRHRALRMHCPS